MVSLTLNACAHNYSYKKFNLRKLFISEDHLSLKNNIIDIKKKILNINNCFQKGF